MLEPDQTQTQDFILQNHDVFFVDTAKDRCEFTCQSLHGKTDEYLSQHPETKQILADRGKVVDSAQATALLELLPSQFGEGMRPIAGVQGLLQRSVLEPLSIMVYNTNALVSSSGFSCGG